MNPDDALENLETEPSADDPDAPTQDPGHPRPDVNDPHPDGAESQEPLTNL